jgi:PKD repeat protein
MIKQNFIFVLKRYIMIHQEVSLTCSFPTTRNGWLASRTGSVIYSICIVLLALTLLPVGVAADVRPDLHPSWIVPNFGGAAAGNVFEREPNMIQITVQNLGNGSAPASVVRLTASDGFSASVSVPAIPAAGEDPGSVTVSIEDPTIHQTAGGYVGYTATADPDSLVAEWNEANNVFIRSSLPIKWNGYKGQALYRDDGANHTTFRTYDIHGGILHSFGNTYYRSGSYGGSWTTFDRSWGYNATPLACDIAVPASATVREVRLYLPFTWDYPAPTRDLPNNTVIRFNGVDLNGSAQTYQWDQGNFGSWGDYRYGLLTYDVTSMYQRNAVNSIHLVRPGTNDKLSFYGMTLLVVYEDPSASRKQIFLDDGFDLLGADPVAYATNETEAIAYIPFTGQTINLTTVKQAELTTFVPSGDSNEGNLYFNRQLVAEDVWNYGGWNQSVGEDGLPQVAVDVRDVKNYLAADNNLLGIQRTAWADQTCMAAAQQFLVVEHYSVPVAGFSADTVTPAIGQNVTFTDTSTNAPTSWAWTFGDSGTSTTQNPKHAYIASGNYTVTLTATNVAGSNMVTRTGYITVGSGATPIKLPGQTNPPTDPDSDGLYEDLNGNGRKDGNDYQLYFRNSDWIAANEPIALFDFNHNSRIDGNDYQLLFRDL